MSFRAGVRYTSIRLYCAVYLLHGIFVGSEDVGFLNFPTSLQRFSEQHLYTHDSIYERRAIPQVFRSHLCSRPTRTQYLDAGCMIRMLQTLSSHHVYGGYFSASAWKQMAVS